MFLSSVLNVNKTGNRPGPDTLFFWAGHRRPGPLDSQVCVCWRRLTLSHNSVTTSVSHFMTRAQKPIVTGELINKPIAKTITLVSESLELYLNKTHKVFWLISFYFQFLFTHLTSCKGYKTPSLTLVRNKGIKDRNILEYHVTCEYFSLFLL